MTTRLMGMLGAVLVLGACNDVAGPTGDRLTREEAALIAGDVTTSGGQTANSARPTTGDAIAADPVTVSHDLEFTHPCPKGGKLQQTWKATASFDVAEGSFDLQVKGLQKHLACAYLHEGVTITVDGDPDIDIEAAASAARNQPGDHTLEINGAFKWTASDGRSGTCPITLDAVTDFQARKKTVEGTVCGHTFKETTSWS